MRNVIITGGGTGIGLSMAKAFDAAGDKVTITGRRLDVLKAAAKGTDFTFRTCDVTDEPQVDALFEHPYDVVIANAGAGWAHSITETSLETWNTTLAINLTGVFLTFRAALRAGMGENGRLIAVASTAALQGGSHISSYAASKHGVLGLVRSVAVEVARSGITCNAICPGFVDTDMAEGATQNVIKAFGLDRDKARAMLYKNNPMQRMIEPEEVAQTALFLASEGASSVNGHALSVSGGEI